jgi:RHS repeat-associated protein
VDGYGRKSRVAVYNGQASKSWYQIDYCYDAAGNLQFQTIPYQGDGWDTPKKCSGNGTNYLYDALGRLTSSTDADGTTAKNYNGRAVKVTRADGVQRITQYDLLGRVTGVCEISANPNYPGSGPPIACAMDIAGTGFVTSYSYTFDTVKSTPVITVTQGAQTRTLKTDLAGRTVSVTEPERGTTGYSYTYNSTGLQVIRTRPRANQYDLNAKTSTTTQYDSIGRPVSVSYDDGLTPFRNFYYDTPLANGIGYPTGVPKGRLVGAIGPSSYELFRYDTMGYINNSYQCMPSVCDVYHLYNRSLLGDLTQDTYYTSGYFGDTISINYTINPARQITGVSGGQNNSVNAPSIVNVTQEGPSGPMTWTLGNGLWGGLTYDSMGRPTAASTCTNDSTIEYCGWNFPAVIYFANEGISGGQVSWKCDTSLGMCQNYYYDEFGRMNSMTSNGGIAFSYVYDRYGNRWNQNILQGTGPSPSYSFNPNTNQINASGFSYDAAGNLTNDGLHSYQYDAEGNLLKVDGGSTATYVYSALNRRSESRTNGGATIHDYFYNLNGQRSAIWDGPSRTMLQAQTYWGTTPVAYYSGGSIHYQHQDWQGTERARTSYNGTNEGLYTNLPFGDGFAVTYASDTDAYHYAQLDNDSESGTQHAQFRQYSSTQGRWMSPDPYDGSYDGNNPQSLNRYSYVLNNPLGWTDRLGLYPQCITVADSTVVSSEGSADVVQSSEQFCFENGGGGGGSVGSGGGGGGGGGGGDLGQFQWTPPAPNNDCPGSTAQKVYASALVLLAGTQLNLASSVAQKTGGTAFFGVSGSAAGGFRFAPQVSRALSGQAVIAVDSQGNIGLLLSGSIGIGMGDGLAAGGDVGWSSSSTIFGLAGPSTSVGFGGGNGVLGGAVQGSNNGGGTVTFTGGWGLGGFGPAASRGPTKVIPLVCHP